MNTEEKAVKIIEDVRKEKGINPVRMFKNLTKNPYINIHGPEHHILDGACLLMAYYNAGGKIDIDEALKKISYEGLRMPGAMCGLWGICGAITSIGAALSIIDGTGPLSADGTWGNHMSFTSTAIGELGKINGPRCCKRDAMIAFKHGIEYVNQHYGVQLEYEKQACEFSSQNQQCIKSRCPYYNFNMKEIIKIDENTWRIEDGMVRFYLLCGSEKAALIDTGMNCPDAKQTAQELTDLPLILINTHADPDHISGNGAFNEFYMSPDEEKNLHAHNAQGKILPIHEGDVIDLGGRELLIVDIPGHTPGSIGIIDKKNRVLISGDSVQNSNIFMFGPGRNLNKYIDSLNHLSKYEELFDEIYPMHGTFPVYKDLIPKLIQGAQAILEGKAQEYAQPVNIFGNDVTLYKFDYAGFLCQN